MIEGIKNEKDIYVSFERGKDINVTIPKSKDILVEFEQKNIVTHFSEATQIVVDFENGQGPAGAAGISGDDVDLKIEEAEIYYVKQW